MAEKAEILLTAKDQTGPAFSSTQRNLAALQSAGGQLAGLAGRLAGIGAGIAAAASALDHFNPKPIIDQADALSKLSQRTGVAVDVLSGYQYAAKLADVSNEDLATGFKKLNLNIAAAARGEVEQSAAFKAIGVSVVDASGKVRSADKVFEDIAERFAGYGDGANKVAIANAVGGKSFEKFIPLLDDGKKGLQAARAELEKYGGVLTGELATKSQQFNDNLTRLGTASDALKVKIAGGLIDSLVAFSERMVEASKNGGLLKAALLELAHLSPTSIGFTNLFLPTVDETAQLTARADNLGKTIDKLREKVAADPGNLPLIARLKTMSDEFESVQRAISRAAVEAADRLGKAPRTAGDFQRTDKDRSGVTLPEAPALPNSAGAANADALLRKQLEGRVKVIQDALDRERDLFQFSDQRLGELYQHGDVSINAYFDAKNKAQLAFIATQSEGFDKLIAAQRDFEAKATKPQDKQDARNKIVEIDAQRAKALREAGQAAETAETQRQRALEEFQKTLNELDAQLADLSGNKYGGELLRNAQRIDDARKLLGKGDVDQSRADELKRLLDLQAAFNKNEQETSQLLERASIAEESFLLKAEAGSLSRLEIEDKLHQSRLQTLADMDKQIEKQAALVALSKDPADLLKLQQLQLARERAAAVADPGLTRFNEQIRGTADLLSTSIEDAIIDGSSKGFKDLEKQLVRMVINDQFTKPLGDSINKFLKGLGDTGGVGGTASGGGGFATLFTGIFQKFAGLGVSDNGVGGLGAKDLGGYFDAPAASSSSGGSTLASLFKFFGSFFHNGGVVGAGGTIRQVNPAVFEGAARFHGGGIAGLGPDEVPAILKRREEVIRSDDPRHRDNGGLAGDRPYIYSPTFVLSNPASKETQSQVAAAAYAGAQRAHARNM